MERISIIIHTYGRGLMISQAIASIRNSVPSEQYEIIVVSSDLPETEKVKWLKNQGDVKLILADTRKDWQMRKRSAYYYINLGIKASSHRWILVINDDMVFENDWYGEFLKIVTDPKNSNVGMIIGAMHLGHLKFGRRVVVIGKTKKAGAGWKDLYLADLAFLRNDVIKSVGFYDEKIDWGGGGADLALAVEFLTDKETIVTDKIKIDHLIAKEERGNNLVNGFRGFHYVHNKWDKWCAENNCEYFWDSRVAPYTIKNRVLDYLRNKKIVLKFYLRYLSKRISRPR